MRPASSVRFHGEASRFTASDPLRQTWGGFGERFEGRRSEPGVFFSYRTGMKVRKGCGRRKGASLWVGLKRGGASFGDCAQWRRVTARCCLKTS